MGTQSVNAKNWRSLERDGLEKIFPQYAAQVALYQAYLDVTNPALFTALNADTCERLHFLVPFDAERAQAWSDRAVTIIEATRACELLPRFTDDAGDWHDYRPVKFGVGAVALWQEAPLDQCGDYQTAPPISSPFPPSVLSRNA